jgi:hypothetical protein
MLRVDRVNENWTLHIEYWRNTFGLHPHSAM